MSNDGPDLFNIGAGVAAYAQQSANNPNATAEERAQMVRNARAVSSSIQRTRSALEEENYLGAISGGRQFVQSANRVTEYRTPERDSPNGERTPSAPAQ